MSRSIFRGRHVAAMLFVVQLLASCGGGSEPSPGAEAMPSALSGPATDQIIVKPSETALLSAYENRATEFAATLSSAAGTQLRPVRQTHDGAHVLALAAPMAPADVAQVAARLRTRSDVAYAEPDLILQTSSIPNDAYFGQLWAMREPSVAAGGINAVDAWDLTSGDSNLVVAVVDTGVLKHQDLGGRVLPGYDFVSSIRNGNDGDGRDSDATDAGDWLTASEAVQLGRTARPSSWHGTHVAGTIGASGNNTTGVAGVNWKSRILPVRVLGKGGGYSSDISDGVAWASGAAVPGVPANPTPARVINLSLGGSGTCSRTMQDAINTATNRLAVVVVAAGNEATNVVNSQPASCAGVVAVGAVGLAGQRASYSNFGAGVTVSAPGGDPQRDSGILSLGDSGKTVAMNDSVYVSGYGTSMAAPHVSGVVSLMLSVNPALSPAEIKALLVSSARAFPTGTIRDCTTSMCGGGIVNAGSAVRAAANATPGAVVAVPQSGIWWNPAEAGRGYVIEVRDGKLQFGAYMYDTSGRATWYASGPTSMQSPTSFTGSLDAYSGGQTIDGVYKPPTNQTNVGQISIQFQNQTTATLTWPGGTVLIERFRFSSTAASPSQLTPEAGVWWSPQESGRGYAIEVQGSTLSMAAFMYDTAGNPTWYLATGPMVGNTFSGNLSVYANGQTLAGVYKSAALTNSAAGAISIRFTDSATASMTLPNGRVIELQKFRIGSTAPGVLIPINQVLTSRLVGIWEIAYSIYDLYVDRFLFNQVRESTVTPGTWVVWGVNQYDWSAVAGWDPDLGHYTIYAPGPLYDDFYVFDMPAVTSMSGCYYLVAHNPTRISICYPLTGTKTAELAPLAALPMLAPPAMDSNTRQIKAAKESAMVESASSAKGSVLKSTPAAAASATVLARKPEIDQLLRSVEAMRSQRK